MKILVTGGLGFIGRHLVKELEKLEQVEKISIIDNLQTGFLLRNSNHTVYLYDICDYNLVQYAFATEQPDIVIHLAAQSNLRKSIINPSYDANVNIIGSVNVFRACKEFGVKRVIYSSTGGARYGEMNWYAQPYIEEHVACNPKSPYGLSKLMAENYLKMFDLKHTILCLSNVIGEGDGSDRIVPNLIKSIKNNIPITIYGDGESERDYIDVMDVISAIVGTIELDVCGVYNVSSNVGTSLNELISMVERVSGYKVKQNRVNALKNEVKCIILSNQKLRKSLKPIDWRPKTNLENILTRIWRYCDV